MSEPFSRIVRVDSIPEGRPDRRHRSKPDGARGAGGALQASLDRGVERRAHPPAVSARRRSGSRARSTGASPRHASFRSSRSRRSSMRRSTSASPSSRTTSPPAGCRMSPRRSRSTTRTNPIRSSTARSISARLAAEFFALGLDPYPRKPGVAFEAPQDREDAASPFSALGGRARKKPD